MSLLRFVPYVPPVLLIVTALVVNLSSAHHAPAKTTAATGARAPHTTPLVQVEPARMKKR